MPRYSKEPSSGQKLNEFTTAYLDASNKRMELELKKQELASKVNGSSGGLKQLIQIAQLENVGVIPPGTSQSVAGSLFSGGQRPNVLGGPQLGIQPQLRQPGQPQQPVMNIAGQQIPAGQLSPQQLAQQQEYAGLTPKDYVGAVGKSFEEAATRPGVIETAKQKLVNKESTDTSMDTQRLMASTLSTQDSFLNYSNELESKYGVKPGLGGAFFSMLTPNEALQYKEAFQGAVIENAAQVAAVSIPQSRAVRVVEIFKKDAPSMFSTIESGVNNSERSWVTAVSKDAVLNPKEYGISPYLSKDEIARQANIIATKSGKKFKDTYLKKAYKLNKDMFSEKKTSKYVESLLKEDSQLDRIRSRILGGVQ